MGDEVRPPSPERDGGDGGAGSDPMVGSVLAGRYRILRRIGEGAMGAVYLGEHLKIGRQDAIKVLRPSLVRDQEAIARFARGARNASRIHHPNVCTVYDFAEAEEDFWFLALEYVEGEELSALLEREGPLPVERAVELTIQIARALGAAHRLGIVHRDLKPGNVMVGRGAHGGDVAKVVDFDIAKGSAEGQAADLTRMGFTIGTPEYMSPEQLMVDRLDGRSDLYSLALVLFRMLTGRLPFRGSTANELMLERLNQEPLTLAEVSDRSFPAGLQPLLDRALQRRPDDRPADAVAFMAELEAAVREQGVGGEGAAPGAPGPGSGLATSPADDGVPEVPPTRVERGLPRQESSDAPSRPPRWVQWAPVVVGALAAFVVAAAWALLIPRTAPFEVPEEGAAVETAAAGVSDDPADGAGPADEASGEGGRPDGGGAEAEAAGGGPGPAGGSGDPPREGGGGGEARAGGDEAPGAPAATGAGAGGEGPPPSSAEPEPPPDAERAARRLDELSQDFLENRIAAGELRRGAADLYAVPGLPDSLQARVAYGVFVGATAEGDQAEACLWIRRAADHAPDNDRYRSLARGCGS